MSFSYVFEGITSSMEWIYAFGYPNSLKSGWQNVICANCKLYVLISTLACFGLIEIKRKSFFERKLFLNGSRLWYLVKSLIRSLRSCDSFTFFLLASSNGYRESYRALRFISCQLFCYFNFYSYLRNVSERWDKVNSSINFLLFLCILGRN